MARLVLFALALAQLCGCQSVAPGSSAAPTAAPWSGKRYGLTDRDFNDAIRRGEGQEAMAFYRHEADRRLAGGDRPGALVAFSRAMSMAYRTAELQEGLRIARRSLEVLDEGDSSIPGHVECQIMDLVGTVHSQAGLIDAAERYWQRGLAAAFSYYWVGVFNRQLASVARSRGDAALARERLSRAIELFEMEIARGAGLATRRELVRSLSSLASLQPPVEAEGSLRRALPLAELIGFADEQIWALVGLANLALQRNDYAEADRRLDEAFRVASQAKHNAYLVWVRRLRGLRQYQQGQYEAALTEFHHAIAIVESVRGRLVDSTVRSLFVEDKQLLYSGAVLAALQASRPSEAFALAERARARAFLDLLGTQTVLARSRTRTPAAAKASVRATPTRVAAGAPDAPGSGPSQLDDDAVAKYERLIERVRTEDQEQASLMTVEPVDVRDVQALLPADAALVAYLVMANETVAWVVRRDGLEVVRLPVTSARLGEMVGRFRRSIADRADQTTIIPLARDLHATLFEPVTSRLRASRVILVPHDVLHYLPFGALRTAQETWLIEDFTLLTVPSASVLKYLVGKGAEAPSRALVVGNPDRGGNLALPFAEREARMVRERFPDTTLLLGRDATKANVKALAPRAGLIHFATHAQFRADDPMASALLVAAPDGGVDELDVREIFALDLNARLVVLSACETGLGQLSRGDELIGLQRAFLYAGTPAVVTTLWQVDDRATFELMEGFYAALAGHDPAEALRQAQRAGLVRHPHPFFWAAFVFTGAPR